MMTKISYGRLTRSLFAARNFGFFVPGSARAARPRAYREALKEMTPPQTDPTNYQLTMKNLNQVLTLLKKKSRKARSVH
jgi:hypothetical protein